MTKIENPTEPTSAEVLTDILPRVMADLKRRSRTLDEELLEVMDEVTDAILEAAMPDIRDIRP